MNDSELRRRELLKPADSIRILLPYPPFIHVTAISITNFMIPLIPGRLNIILGLSLPG